MVLGAAVRLDSAMRSRIVVMLPRGHHGRDRMLEDQLLLMVRLKHHAVFIKAFHSPGKFHTAREVDRDRSSFFAGVIEKAVL